MNEWACSFCVVCGTAERTRIVSTCLDNGKPLALERVDELVSRLKRLPSEQGVYHKVLRELKDPNGNLEQVGLLVGSDPAITIEVIKTVNSAALGISRTISDPIDAVMLLGGDQVLAIVLMVEVFGVQEGIVCQGFSFMQLLSHSRTVAWNARSLMRQQCNDREQIGAAFTGGLLHDVGKLLLAANFPREYERCTDEQRELAEFGAGHAVIGARFLHRWEMPHCVVEAVRQHNQFEPFGGPVLSLSEAIYVANVQAHYRQQTSPSGLSLSEQLNVLKNRFGRDQMSSWGFK